MIDAAKDYTRGGLSVIPTRTSDKTPTLHEWKSYRSRIATPDEISDWFSDSTGKAIALVCGKVSGNVELIDIDNHFGNAEDVFAEWHELLENTLPGVSARLVIEKTPSGGYHAVYRCDKIGGNKKLASKLNKTKRKETLIETRGEGGYALIAPSPGYELIRNDFFSIPTITPEERDAILAISGTFDETIAEKPVQKDENYIGMTAQNRPGDVFNAKGDIDDVLMGSGWKMVVSRGNKSYWRRPGKDRGVSATFNHYPGKLFVFSSNADPFEPDHAYDKFQVYSLLVHNGDFKKAAKDLAERGYGEYRNGGFGSSAINNKNSHGNEAPDNARKENQGLQPQGLVEIIEDYLTRNFDLRYNEIKSYVEFSPKGQNRFEQLTDRQINEIWRVLKKMGVKPTLQSIDSILKSDFVVNYNPLKDYFSSLPEWDGENHIKNFCELIKVEENQRDLWRIYFMKWIVGVVANALERGLNHTCIVLVGAQGIGKTTIIGKLVPPQLRNYYSITQLNPSDKDSKIMITESFLINLDELESSTREEIGHLKSLMTIEQVTVRKPYARYTETYKRRASFIGSVNKSMFLTDVTGSRRFLVVDAVEININAEVNVHQIYAQALSKLNEGFQYWFTGKEIEKINEQNRRYQITSPEEELLITYFQPFDIKGMTQDEIDKMERYSKFYYMSTTDIFSKIQDKINMKLSLVKLGLILKNLGFHQTVRRFGNQIKRVYLVQDAPKGAEAF